MRGGALGGLCAAGLAASSTLSLSAPAWANTLQQVQGGYSQAKTLALGTRPKPDPPDPQWPASIQQTFIGMLEGSGVSYQAALCMNNIMIHTYQYTYYQHHNVAQGDYWVREYWPQMNACVLRYPSANFPNGAS
jgi:hypothetical protein